MGTVVSKKKNAELSDSTAVKIRYFSARLPEVKLLLQSQSCCGFSEQLQGQLAY